MIEFLDKIKKIIVNKEKPKEEIQRLIGVTCQLYDREEDKEKAKEKLKEVIALYRSTFE